MARPIYESDADRRRERDAISLYCAKRRVSFAKLPMFYEVDFALLLRGKVVGCAEVKIRSARYSTMILSLHKWLALCAWANAGLQARVLVMWPSGLHLFRVQPNVVRDITMGGRVDRADDQDVEPVVHLPTSEFEAV